MGEAELIAGMRRELFRNILVAPIVLLVRLPAGLIYAILSGLVEALERLGDHLPGWRLDYLKALRNHRRDIEPEPTLLPERPDHG